MVSKSHASATLFIALNFLFFCIVAATYCPPPPCKHCTKPTPSPKPKSPPKAPKTPKTPTPTTPKIPPAPVPKTPTPSTPTPTPSTPTPTPSTPTPTPATPTPATPTPSTPTPTPTPSTPTPTTPPRSCPRDVLQLGVCGNLLDGLINVVIGSTPSNRECCSLLQGLADLDAAICLCTAIRANVLGINLNVPISLSLLLNSCDIPQPSNFQCA